jgi:hypothetical protein
MLVSDLQKVSEVKILSRNLLVLNIGMEEIKFAEHEINLPLSPSR